MALVKCGECGNEVSTQAKACPKCGAVMPKPKKSVGPVGLLFGAIVLGAIIMGFVNTERDKTDRAAVEAAKTPEQRAAEKAASDKRTAQLQTAGAGAVALKSAMKDPTAFELTSLLVMPSGAACYEYRAKNSFGAVLPSAAVLTSKGKMLSKEANGNAFVGAWNKECTVIGGDEVAPLVKTLGII